MDLWRGVEVCVAAVVPAVAAVPGATAAGLATLLMKPALLHESRMVALRGHRRFNELDLLWVGSGSAAAA